MPKILVVDDDGVDRELAYRCLRTIDDLEILFAENGVQALELIVAQEPDLVLTDLKMPIMDGLELVEEISEAYPLLPMVLMTSKGSEQTANEALRAGARSYVPKEFLKEDLEDTILQVLEMVDVRWSPTAAILNCLDVSETRFELDNDPKLIPLLVSYLRSNLERLHFGDDSTRSHVGMALVEALTNAMIHGNLEVGSELRGVRGDRYHRLIAERRKLNPYSQRRVHCVARESPHRVEYSIRDQGSGFDVEALPDPTAPHNLLKVSGRGILLIRTFMDEVQFNRNGSEVVMRKADSD